MRLRSGRPPDSVVSQLRELARRSANGGDVLSGISDTWINNYVSWVSTAEKAIRHCLVDPDLDALYTPRYWAIRAADPASLRISELVWDESTWQSDRFNSMADEIDDTVSRLRGDPSALVVVVDTNVFLHYQSLDNIDWSFVGASPVRIVIPIRVIEELDEKKRDRRDSVQDRARKSLRWLSDRVLTDEPVVKIRDGVTVEVFVPTGRRELRLSADSEILEACEVLEQFTGKRLALVTGDLGMQLKGMHYRGSTSGFDVKALPDRYELSSTGA